MSDTTVARCLADALQEGHAIDRHVIAKSLHDIADDRDRLAAQLAARERAVSDATDPANIKSFADDLLGKTLAENEALGNQFAACIPYLKEGETPEDRISREIADNVAVLTLLAQARADRDRLAAELAEVRDRLDRASAEQADAERDYKDALAAILGWRMELEKRDAELSAARADAERYRWLRSRNELTGEIDPRGPYVIEDDDGTTRWPTGDQIDAAIDAARATDSAGGEQS